MIRMLIVGYCFGIRSERRLCEEVHLNLAYRWFCQLGLEDAVPDHSTFSRIAMGGSATATHYVLCLNVSWIAVSAKAWWAAKASPSMPVW